MYSKPEHDYDKDYRPAYRYGTQARNVNPNREWDDKLETELGNRWKNARTTSRLSSNEAKHAAKDAWHNVERALPGDTDGDGC